MRASTLGWAGGGSIPGSAANVAKLRAHPDIVRLCRWGGGGGGGGRGDSCGGGAEGRGRVMPHVKSYLRHAADGAVAWAVIGSHNLSPAAWGALERDGAQLLVRRRDV